MAPMLLKLSARRGRMDIQNTVSILNQRLAKQLWVSIALASFLPIFVSIYLVSSLFDSKKPEVLEVATMLGFAIIFSLLGSYLIYNVLKKVRMVSERAIKVAAPNLPAMPGVGNEI